MTSTLQQEAGRKLRFSSKRAMQIAQRLYEDGWITYMRTDSTTLSSQALDAARAQASALYGPDYVPGPAPPLRAQGQERPGGPRGHPAGRGDLPYARRGGPLAVGRRVPPLRPHLEADRRLPDGRRHRHQRPGPLAGTGRPGRRAPAGERPSSPHRARSSSSPATCGPTSRGRTTPRPSWPTARSHLPPMAEGDPASVADLEPGSHATQPPARYTEASLVKAMEDLGVGRPSTYASVIATILDRGYVWKKGTALVPSFTAFAVVGLLERYFADLVDYGFTASMEDDLDAIASGNEESLPWLTRFYFGAGPSTGRRRTGAADGNGDGDGTATGRPRAAASASSARWHLPRRDRRPRDQLDPHRDGCRRRGDRGPGGPVRPLPAARRGPGLDPRGPGSRRADHRAGRVPARGALVGSGAG